jgi:hypothetical protein
MTSIYNTLHYLTEAGTTQVERYGPYAAVYGYFTDRITAVYCENTASYTMPYYCAQDYAKIRSVYGAV